MWEFEAAAEGVGLVAVIGVLCLWRTGGMRGEGRKEAAQRVEMTTTGGSSS